MSTHSFISKIRKDVCLPLKVSVPVLGALLMTLLYLLSPTVLVFAASAQQRVALPPQQLLRAGVSVVRLVVTYTSTSASVIATPTSTPKSGEVKPTATLGAGSPSVPAAAQFQCTGLGVIVASWAPTSSSDLTPNTLIVTDGNLVQNENNTAKCVTPSLTNGVSKLTLTSITVYFSNTFSNSFNGRQALSVTTVAPVDVRCKDTTACGNSVAIFALHTAFANPFVSLAGVNDPAQGQGIELANSASTPSVTLKPSIAVTKQDPGYTKTFTGKTNFLTPGLYTSNTPGEAGMPMVNVDGKLVSILLPNETTPVTPQDLSAFVISQKEWQHQQPETTNVVKMNWDKGITAFYNGKASYAEANTAFNTAVKANPQFQGAQQLANDTQNAPPPQQKVTFPIVGSFPAFWLRFLLVGGGVLVLLIVLLIVFLFLRRPRRTLDYQELEDISAKQYAELTAQERGQQSLPYAEQQTIPSHQQPFGRTAQPDALILGMGSPLPSAEQPTLLPQQQMPVELQPTLPSYPLPPNGGQQGAQPPMGPQQPPQPRPIADQPTLVPINNSGQEQFRQQSPANLYCPVCNGLVAQTTEMCPTCGTPLQFNGVQMVARTVVSHGPNDATVYQTMGDQTLTQAPINSSASNGQIAAPVYQQGLGQRLGFVAGTRTNPGIKRKHKPNEDSLFAAQGVRGMQNTMQPFGLFVVADGMGGHANGQDASRLAIQTIVDYMLPLLVSHPEMTGEDLRKLLVEGVQRANQAVHQHNMEQRADMGTTMTAALIVDTTAYVANVGDSRTYLYREPYGLVKITQDHSVVASLVDAGIIKPDDIYTHPKRNQIYRSLGEKPNVEVDSFMQALIPNDKLLLCSDGLWDMVRDPNIAEVLKQQAPDPGMTGEGLIQAALAGGGEDNVSVIVVQIVEPSGDRQGLQLGVQLLARPDTLNMPSVPQLQG